MEINAQVDVALAVRGEVRSYLVQCLQEIPARWRTSEGVQNKTRTKSPNINANIASITYISSRGGGLPKTLPICACGLRLWADISFAAFKAQFFGQTLGQLSHSCVLEVQKKRRFSK